MKASKLIYASIPSSYLHGLLSALMYRAGECNLGGWALGVALASAIVSLACFVVMGEG